MTNLQNPIEEELMHAELDEIDNPIEKPQDTFLKRLRDGQLKLGPVVLQPERPEIISDFLAAQQKVWQQVRRAQSWPATAIWGKRTYKMLICFSDSSTPKAVDETATIVEALASKEQRNPLFIVPFLSEQRIAELEQRGVSAFDLGGNGVLILTKEGVLIWHTCEENRYKDPAPIKNVYKKRVSIVARMFLLQQFHSSFKALCIEIEQRGGRLTRSSVSKVVKTLHNDKILHAWGLELANRQELLDKLSKNFEPLQPKHNICLYVRGDPWDAARAIMTRSKELNVHACLSGASSAFAYLETQPPEKFDIVAELDEQLLDAVPDAEVGVINWNLRLLKIDDDRAYFAKRWIFVPNLAAHDVCASSWVQAFLELNHSDNPLDKLAAQELAKKMEGESQNLKI